MKNIQSELNKLSCSACSRKTPELNYIEINRHIKNINNWQLNDDRKMIFKKIIFKNFKQSLEFTNLIGQLAESEGHHPDISIGWGYCLILIHTHAIKGLSINDFILAAKIDLINV